MKKPIAILILLIYLFNLSGRWVMHQYFAYLSGKFFSEQTSKGLYYTGDLTLVKLPANMPGITDWAGFENISGSIRFENASYNYVKMKITRTALYLMCIPDYKTTRLSNQNVIDARQAKNIPVPKKNHVPYGKITLLSKFSFAFVSFAFTAPVKTLQEIPMHLSLPLPSRDHDIPRKPPKFSC